jgi:hypothetical protein
MNKHLLALFAGAFLSCGGADAAVLDFVAEAAGNERGVADGTVIVLDGLPVEFSAGPPDSQFAYFDDVFEGRPAGLGVCSTLEGPPPADCAIAADDNLQAGESVTLTFPVPLDLSDFSFNDDDHFSLNSSASTLLINGVAFTFADVVNLTAAVAAVVTGITSITFGYGGDNPAAYYVASFVATPLPAAAPLFFAGLAGLAFASRKKRR